MSVVLAVKDGDRIWMAADSQASRGGTKFQLSSPNTMKVWKVEGHSGMLMGGAGSARDINIMYTKEDLYDPILDRAGEEINFKFVVRNIIPEIFNELGAYGRTTQGEYGLTSNSSWLLAKDDKCYQIESDGFCSDMSFDKEAKAVGSGSDIALAVYNAMADLEGLSVKEKLIRAVSQACNDDLYVNFPIVIMNTKDDFVEFYDGFDLYSTEDVIEEAEIEVEEKVDNE